MFHIGIVSGRIHISAVTLQDGKYFDKFRCDLGPVVNDDPKLRFNRNFHLSNLYDAIDEYISGHNSEDVRVTVQSVFYDTNKRILVETAQTVGSILSLPYTVHEVSQWSWKNNLIGKGGVTVDEVRSAISERFGLESEFGEDQDWFDAFCVARFGYLKDQSDPRSSMA